MMMPWFVVSDANAVTTSDLLSILNTWVMVLGALVTIILFGSFYNLAREFWRAKKSEAKMRELEKHISDHMLEFERKYNLASLKSPEAILLEARKDFDPRIDVVHKALEAYRNDLSMRVRTLELRVNTLLDVRQASTTDEAEEMAGGSQ